MKFYKGDVVTPMWSVIGLPEVVPEVQGVVEDHTKYGVYIYWCGAKRAILTPPGNIRLTKDTEETESREYKRKCESYCKLNWFVRIFTKAPEDRVNNG